jgi:hypothetical protein
MKSVMTGYAGFRKCMMYYNGNIVQYMRRTKDAK